MTPQQLHLIETPRDTRLDEHTKAVGRRGLAMARAALADAERRRAAQALDAERQRSSAA